MSLLLALILQVGPFTSAQERPVSPVPAELRERNLRESAADAPLDPAARLRGCLNAAEASPAAALVDARAWLAASSGADRALAQSCIGAASVALDLWADGEAAFLAARDTPGLPGAERAGYGAMAANAALAAGAHQRALALLDLARTDAEGSNPLIAGIDRDRARALVALQRAGEAAGALDAARRADPQNAEGFLLSATLARRQGDLAAAQGFIETAAAIDPADPAIGLEAGVIAVLAGRHAAARKSWESVIATSPDSAEAQTARGYLAQLAPAVTTAP